MLSLGPRAECPDSWWTMKIGKTFGDMHASSRFIQMLWPTSLVSILGYPRNSQQKVFNIL